MLELIKLENTIKLDIRYAREDNVVGRPVYEEARAFLQPVAAKSLVRVHQKLREKNLGLIIFDGYRPWSVTKLFWEVVREDQKKFVADPAKGSKHNRGCAVDLSMFDLNTGNIVEMPSDFDEFNEKASPDYIGGTDVERENRDLLRRMMELEDFIVNPKEWWHFDHKDWEKYEIFDIPFSEFGEK
ncbi:MAG: M15 family metallopeptidase [Aridibacter sp.]